MKSVLPCLFGIAAFFSLSQSEISAQIQINDSLPAETLVQDFFNSGVLVNIYNVTYNGASADSISPRLGLFTDGLTDGLNMDSGLIMYTGLTKGIVGNIEWLMLENYQDSDIETITGVNVNDCAVLEFDVVVEADALAFNYFFASTEYASFTCSNYNDGFGLFISGPGLNGPYTNNAVNIATIPNSNVPVAINTVNSGESSVPGNESYCENANPNWIEDSQYFIENSGNEVNDLTFSGYTQNFEAYVDIINGSVYHIKFAICDASDGSLDSGVFLEAGSFEGRLMSDIGDIEKRNINIYPNPARDYLHLEGVCEDCSGEIEIEIVDLRGRIVAQFIEPNAELIQIATTGIESGIYILKVSNNNQMIGNTKFVKD